MYDDHISNTVHQARTRLSDDHIINPLAQLVGTHDLRWRIETFLNLSEAADCSGETIKSYRSMLGNFVHFVNGLGAILPEDVGEEHVVAFILYKKKTCNGVSVATYYHHVRAWFNWMVSRGIIPKSPCAALKTPSVPKTVIKPVSVDEVQKMLAHCTGYGWGGERDKAIILLIYDSGLRRSEVSNIQMKDVDFDRGAIKVMGKGAKERYVAIGEATRRAIGDYLLTRKDLLPWLFLNRYKNRPGKLTPESISRMIRYTMRRAGITGVKRGPHTLRHSFATAAIRNGANLFYVQSLLGHSTLNMTRRYAATVDSEEAVRNHHSFSPVDLLNKKKPPS